MSQNPTPAERKNKDDYIEVPDWMLYETVDDENTSKQIESFLVDALSVDALSEE